MRIELMAKMLLVLGATVCLAPDWADPTSDPVDSAAAPTFDLVDTRISFEPGLLVLELSFNPATTTSSLDELSGFIDFDVDSSQATGWPSHIEQFGLVPPPLMGVDYYLQFAAYSQEAELFRFEEQEPVASCHIERNDTILRVNVTRCGPAPCAGIAIGARFQLSVLVGNNNGELTDRAPNSETPYTAVPARGDFDEDGDVDGEDLNSFKACSLGPGVPQAEPACRSVDFDDDGDVDQDDFGMFQRNITGHY